MRVSVIDIAEIRRRKDVEPSKLRIVFILDSMLSVPRDKNRTSLLNMMIYSIDSDDASAVQNVIDFGLRVAVLAEMARTRRANCDAGTHAVRRCHWLREESMPA